MMDFDENTILLEEYKPLISVVLPVYNVEPYIKEAIDSVMNQTIQDFEILIIDDCSTDNTLDVVRAYDDERIKIITKACNKGLIDSLNIGFELAKGKYIARMDGDDINVQHRFEKQIEILEKNPNIKACGCWLQEFGSSNRIIKHRELHNEIVARLLISCSMSLGGVMLNREWAIRTRFDENKKHVEDYDFWARMAWSGDFYNIQEVLYYYRIHENQISTVYNHVQRQGDAKIKLFLVKKINYDKNIFHDEFIEKMFFLKETFTLNEFDLYLKWFKKVISINKQSRVFDPFEFEKVIIQIKDYLIFKIYFQNSDLNITKKWRQKALFKMSFQDIFKVVYLKGKEKIKSWIRKKE